MFNQTTNKRFGKYKRVSPTDTAIANMRGLRGDSSELLLGGGGGGGDGVND